MYRITDSYEENVRATDEVLRVKENFDLIRKQLQIGQDEMTLYYLDGFVQDGSMQKLMMSFLALKGLEQGPKAAEDFLRKQVASVEAEITQDAQLLLHMVLSGAVIAFGSTFGAQALIIDARSYPARDTQEPEGDRVMRGARDGFVETLINNTALIRRRIRDPQLTMEYISVGEKSRTDLVLCYLNGTADPELLDCLRKKLNSVKTDALVLGHESVAEVLIQNHWYNPFPKIRYTERPDAAAAQILEGSVILLVDNAPTAMILPTSIFDFMQETNDFYFTPLTGSYLRIMRHIVFLLTLFMIPVWYLLVRNAEILPAWMDFLIPQNQGRIPLFAQILLAEFALDALRMASLNTPSMLSNSLSAVGGLILGDFAVDIGWLTPEVILYIAFVAIANFTQRSYELGYAFKFLRLMLVTLVWLFNFWGFGAGMVLIVILLLTNKTVNGTRSYLYPLIPFNGPALMSLFVRKKKI